MTIPVGAPIRWTYTDRDAPDMPHRGQTLSGFLRLVSTVESAGAVPPPAFVELRDRLLTFSRAAAGHDPILFERLCDAITSGAGDAPLWFAAAMAERGQDQTERRSEVLGQLHDTMCDRLRAMYQPNAMRIYCQLAAEYDRAAQDFTRAANIVDPATDAAEVVDGPRKVLDAWRHALVAANRLDELVEPLSAAAELVRPLHLPSGQGTSRVPLLLPLCCDSEGLHRRVIWHAWHDWEAPRPPATGLTRESMELPPEDTPQGTRCGRWARLWAAGATLRANPNPATMQLFGQLQPLMVRPVPRRDRAVLERFDPEGELPTETPKRRWRDMFKRGPEQPEPEPDLLDTFLTDDTQGGAR